MKDLLDMQKNTKLISLVKLLYKQTLAQNSQAELYLLLFVSLIVIATFIALSFAAFPVGDDYCYAVKATKLGFLGNQVDWYTNWSGRFSSTALMSIFSLSSDIVHTYSLALIVAQLVTMAAIFLLLRGLIQKQYPLRYTLLASLCAYVIFLTGLPDVAQTIYWTMGVAAYGLGNISLLLLLAIGAQFELGSKQSKLFSIFLFVMATAVTVIAVSDNEVTLVTVLSLLAGASLLSIKRRTGSAWFWTGLFIVALCAALASILAPGNLARAQSLATDGMMRPHGALAALLFLPWFLLRTTYWLANPAIWVSAVLLLVISRDKARQILYREGVFMRAWMFVPAIWGTLLLALTGIGFAINHYPLPERAESVVWLVFLIGWYPSFIILMHYAAGNIVAVIHDSAKRLLVVMLVICMVGAPNIFEAFKDSYRGVRYWKEMNARQNLIRDAKQNSIADLKVPSLSRPPRTLYTTEISSDPTNFRNTCLAEYHGLRSISF
jgi:hypothetical protein